MAANLQRHVAASNGTLFINDVSSNTSRRFADQHKATIASPTEIVENCDVVITMLPGPQQVKTLYRDMAKAAKKNQLFIDSSTIDATTIIEASEWMSEQGAFAVDAPVSGGTGGASNGTLTFMVGAPTTPADFFSSRVEPILKPMAGKIWNCGTVGSGQTAKIANNMILGVSMIAVSEAMNLGIRSGVDSKVLTQIINSSSGRCWSSDTYNPVPGVMDGVPSARNYEGGFGVKLMNKDLGLALEAARATNSTCLMGSVAWQVYTQLSSGSETSTKDFSIVYKWLNDNFKQ
ncbi:3-hydroxyisobutyrate dehydrogenase [Gonapodya prolifera JEL478]|uniref:3-hydroxyisobutyrate dehydrogenase n=1 Tax=Gonapodya prolifera (strain JEL478) TaxID=1344416 RepID=A0A139ANC6_GONPJ|nr:3-hydroxyisobutyrate dehydrogenase [Gonapodya prolifera JEL478]|eukprot:KXS18134.1 3-hydroxyisobutyrate dehydrogenase [Gonapodya prolifera JEL478]